MEILDYLLTSAATLKVLRRSQECMCVGRGEAHQILDLDGLFIKAGRSNFWFGWLPPLDIVTCYLCRFESAYLKW
jgi:hypothetical protein